ncbi:MAG: nuclear transport factor 2 family protein [Actinomycetia bacterium]|nr:nuclear transport factor 2 family protein [Actinomycetes bacterium]
MRFNPPPNWPPPQDGWVPSPGWTPDPTWPPPPAGWQLWIDDDTTPAGAAGGVAAPPPGPPGPAGSRKLVIGLAALAAAIVAVGVATLIIASQKADAPKSDEDQIREALSGLVEAYNNSDYDTYVSHICPSERSGLSDASELKQDRSDTGRLSFDDISIDVTGDTAKVTATATVENEEEPDTETVDFAKEDGRWMMLFFEDKCSA